MMLTDKQRAQTALRQRRFRKRQQEARKRELKEKGLPPMPTISTMPGTARWQAALESAEALLGDVVAEMENYYDDRTETWQDSIAGADHQQRQHDLNKMLSELGEILLLW
jgi:hypothetical protein